MYEDKTLVCKECSSEFVFTAGEQEFYATRGFENEPQRCKPCRDNRKNASRAAREMHEATCASCGAEAKVPFKPREDRPVYCSECFAKMKEEESAQDPVQPSAPEVAEELAEEPAPELVEDSAQELVEEPAEESVF